GGDLCRSFHPLGRAAVNHAHHAASLFGFCNDHFHWVGGRAENRTHLGYVLHDVQQVYGIRITQDENEYMPAGQSRALAMAAFRSSSSLPSARVRHGPEDSLKASPNLACGTVFTTALYMSSAVATTERNFSLGERTLRLVGVRVNCQNLVQPLSRCSEG